MYSPSFDTISKHSLNNGFGSGTGPYQFKKWAKNKYIQLIKFEKYWQGWEKNHFDNVLIQVASEASTRYQMIKSGLADYVTLIPNQLIEKLENNPRVNVSYHHSWTNEFYLLNTKKPPTDNLWFRRAIASSLDRNTLSTYIYKNAGVASKG